MSTRCTTCRSGIPSRCPASRTSGRCSKSTTGHSSRRKARCPRPRSWPSTTTGRSEDPPLHPLPFHAVFDTDLYARDPPRAFAAVASQVGRRAGRQDPHAGQRAPRRVAAARIVRPDPGIRRHRRGFDGVRIAGHTNGSRATSVGRRQRRQPRRARRGRRHRASPAQLSGIPHTGGRAPPGRLVRRPRCPLSTACSATACPTAARCPTSKPRPRCCASSSAGPKPCPRSSPTGCGSSASGPTSWPRCAPTLPPTCRSRARR